MTPSNDKQPLSLGSARTALCSLRAQASKSMLSVRVEHVVVSWGGIVVNLISVLLVAGELSDVMEE